VAVAIVAAVIAQFSASLAFWNDRGIDNVGSQSLNFFSFFTVESNIAAAVVLAVGAVLLAVRPGPDPTAYALTRASVVTYMVVTGVVYNLLLRGIELPQGSTVAWSNEVLHVVAPLYLLIDWVFAPGRSPIAPRKIWVVLVFPLVWTAYTLVRGPFVDDQVYGNAFWYPYPFLNPFTSANGYLSVTFYVILIAVVIGLVAAGVLWISRRRATPLTR
jgi:hypothetical protein